MTIPLLYRILAQQLMKTIAAFLSLFTIGIGFPAFGANQVTLTSADGSKTMDATIEQYYPANGSATIKVNGRKLTVPVTAFQSEDKAKFENFHLAKLAGRSLMLSFADNESEGSEKKTSNSKVKTVDAGFKIQVRNNAQTDLDGVKLEYRLFYYKDKAKGGKEAAYTDGDLDLGKISPRETKELDTTSITLTRVRPLPASQCAGGT